MLLIVLGILLATMLHALPVQDEDDGDDDKRVGTKIEKETIQKTFTLSGAGERYLDIDNVFGSIEVVTGPGDQIRVTAERTTHADTTADVERAKKEVTLDVSQEGNVVKLLVNGPFRCNDNCNCWSNRERDYEVTYDFKVTVPEQIGLKVHTVNHGRVSVKGVQGDFNVANVNGPIDMDDIGGSGRAKTVNGRVRVSFRKNPTKDSEFGTINGNVDLYFNPGLSADFRFKTMQGGIYTDFPMTTLAPEQPVAERKNGRFRFRTDRFSGGRIGNGGPNIKLENLNGDLRVLARATK
jgi:hypothetical protein